jgi:hypothetical protein
MTEGHEHEQLRLTIDIEPGLRKRVESAAAEQGMTVRDYVAAVLRATLDSQSERLTDSAVAWSRLSAPSFARDWESDADAIYDDLA